MIIKPYKIMCAQSTLWYPISTIQGHWIVSVIVITEACDKVLPKSNVKLLVLRK